MIKIKIKSPTIGVKVVDRHFIAAWSLSDAEKIDRYVQRMSAIRSDPCFAERTGEYTRLADAMIDLVTKRDNDHHNATGELGHDWLKVEPINDVKLEPDMVTYQGTNKLLRLAYGLTTGVFKYMGRGGGAATPTPYTTALTSETGSRQDCGTTGFYEVKGSSLRFMSSYASSIASSTIYQMGVFDASSTGIMLAIHDFGGYAYDHVVNVDAFSLGMIVDVLPFGDV